LAATLKEAEEHRKTATALQAGALKVCNTLWEDEISESDCKAMLDRLDNIEGKDLERHQDTARLCIQATLAMAKSHYPSISLKAVSSGVAKDFSKEDRAKIEREIQSAAETIAQSLDL
jgi:hypothetical protein